MYINLPKLQTIPILFLSYEICSLWDVVSPEIDQNLCSVSALVFVWGSHGLRMWLNSVKLHAEKPVSYDQWDICARKWASYGCTQPSLHFTVWRFIHITATGKYLQIHLTKQNLFLGLYVYIWVMKVI
jgi:hypothetical protein